MKKLKSSLHAYIKLAISPLNKADFGILSIHKAYIKPTQILHDAYMMPS